MEEYVEYISRSPEDTARISAEIATQLRAGDIILYEGDMGAGKTTFTKGLAAALGITDPVTSPTFALVNEYTEGRLPLFHFDMYRLAGSEDLFDIGWEDYLARGGVCAVEWSEQVADALPEDAVTVTLARHPDHDGWRIITVEGGTIQ